MSLRARVLLAMGLVAIVVLGGAFFTTRLAEQRLVDQIDRRLIDASGPVNRGLPPDGRFQLDPDRCRRNRSAERPRGFNEFYVAVLRGTTELVVLGRPNVSSRRLSPPLLDGGRARGAAASTDPQPYTVDARDGNLRYRVITRAEPTNGDTFILAAPLTSVDASTRELRNIAWTVALLVVAVLALVAWWVIRLGVRPLQRMATAAVAIADDDLTRRVPEAAKGTEAGDLSVAINNMLGRLEDSFAATRRDRRSPPPLRRRRQPRAADAGADHPWLLRALRRGRARRLRATRRRDAPHRPGIGAHGEAHRRTPDLGPARPGPSDRATARRSA